MSQEGRTQEILEGASKMTPESAESLACLLEGFNAHGKMLAGMIRQQQIKKQQQNEVAIADERME